MDVRAIAIGLIVVVLAYFCFGGRTEMNNLDDPAVAAATDRTLELIGGKRLKQRIHEDIRRVDASESTVSSESEEPENDDSDSED
jgi:hypothetical protein